MKKAIKGFLGLTCAALLSVSLVACGEEPMPPPEEDKNPPVEQSKDPAVVGEARGYYFEELPGDMTFNMRMNGGAFQSVKADGTELTRNNEYKFNIGTEVLTLNNSWLATLSEGDHTVTFTTDLGSCNITVTIGEKGLADGYNLQIVKTNQELNDNFYVKAGRTEKAVTFDFLTFGDFGKEGAGLEFINVLIDNPPFDDTGLNWRLSSEDMNVRVYSDGSVVYRTFTGTEEKNGVQNGMDNIWWRINRTKPNYKTEGVNDVTISREHGVTKFSLELTYEFLKIGAEDDIRFALMECSDASQNDFNLYDNGIVALDGVAFDNPVKLSHWPMLDGEGNVVRPENIVIKGAPEDYELTFATGGDRFYGKTSLAENGVKFDFWTKGNFGTGANGGMEFVNIYLDMPNAGKWNKTGRNWAFESEDINLRVYSDGTVYKKTGFDGSTDNVWYSRQTGLTDENKLSVTAETTKKNGAAFISVTVPYSEFNGATKDTFGGFRFYLAEGADTANNFDYFGADFSYQGNKVGDDWNVASWPLFDNKGAIVLAKDIVENTDGVPEGYNLTFGKAHDNIYSKISYDAATGVTFGFWTDGDFGMNGENLEFVQIYLDMPAFNAYTGANWKFNSNEDIIIRIYSNGNVYFIREFADRADNIWIKLDHSTTAVDKTIAINKTDSYTSFSLTLTLGELGIAEGATLDSFRFLMAECADGGNDFQLYDNADLTYDGKTVNGAHSCDNWATFALATNTVTLP